MSEINKVKKEFFRDTKKHFTQTESGEFNISDEMKDKIKKAIAMDANLSELKAEVVFDKCWKNNSRGSVMTFFIHLEDLVSLINSMR